MQLQDTCNVHIGIFCLSESTSLVQNFVKICNFSLNFAQQMKNI